MSVLHTEGRQFIYEVVFSKQQSVPANYYVGLCTDASLAENANLGDQSELGVDSGDDPGYVRQALASSAVGFVSAATGTNDRKITTAMVTFTADDDSGVLWANAKTWFLATTNDDSGKLIASGPVNSGTGYALTSGQTYSFEVEIVWPG